MLRTLTQWEKKYNWQNKSKQGHRKADASHRLSIFTSSSLVIELFFNLTAERWLWKWIGFKTLPYTYCTPSLNKIGQELVSVKWWLGCHSWKLCKSNYELDLWPWKSICYKILPETNCIQSLVKIGQEMVSVEWWQGCHSWTYSKSNLDLDLWPMTLKINTLQDITIN